jgi:nitrogen regulatory protein PII
MKRITAWIRPVLRDDVISALHQVEDFPGASMSEVKKIRRETIKNIKRIRSRFPWISPYM